MHLGRRVRGVVVPQEVQGQARRDGGLDEPEEPQKLRVPAAAMGPGDDRDGLMLPVRQFCAATFILVAGIAGCASSAGSPAPDSQPAVSPASDYPGSSAPPASPIPGRTSLYKSIPSACATLGTATLRAIAPGIGTGSEQDFSETNEPVGDFVQHVCSWGQASGPDWTRTLLVQVELAAGADARSTADGEYQNEVSADVPVASRTIPGLGDEAQLGEKQYKNSSSALLHILVQNVVITIEYGGTDSGGDMTAAQLNNGALAAAQSVLKALS